MTYQNCNTASDGVPFWLYTPQAVPGDLRAQKPVPDTHGGNPRKNRPTHTSSGLLPRPLIVGGLSPTEALYIAAVEYEDDDYYDVWSDEEDEQTPYMPVRRTESQYEVNPISEYQGNTGAELGYRCYNAFLYPKMLDTYRPERVANPLKNPETARVFAHFITATGPTLTSFVRRTGNSSVLFTGRAVPKAQQGLWTYALPMMALHHQGLLHAMLAVGSLHIARLQGASLTPSLKHYAYSLKRVVKCVGHPKKRHEIPTIAAALLLGYHETMTGDHVKWNSHLVGAKQLFVEIDFASMTNGLTALESQKAFHLGYMKTEHGYATLEADQWDSELFAGSFIDDVPDLDQELLSTLLGFEYKMKVTGEILGEGSTERRRGRARVKQNDHEVLQDLFWWFCYQDMLRSMIGGDRLL